MPHVRRAREAWLSDGDRQAHGSARDPNGDVPMRPEMGRCDHTQERWVKQGPKGVIKVWCCPEAHGTFHRRMLEVKGFTKA